MEYPESRLRDYSTDASIGRGALDVPFAALTILLLTIGVIMVLSASYVRAYYTENGNATYYFTSKEGSTYFLIFSRIDSTVSHSLFLSEL